MRSFRTPKGTELPLMDMRGKDYLQVAHRLVWFREEKPDWSIETELLISTAQEALAKATIKDSSGRVIATGHKTETVKDFPAGHSEKAETGAIGRALALCGYGTQFAPDLDEGERIVDSPVRPAQIKPRQAVEAQVTNNHPVTSSDPGDHIVPFGKYKGLRIRAVTLSETKSSLAYWETELRKNQQQAKPSLANYLEACRNYIDAVERDDPATPRASGK